MKKANISRMPEACSTGGFKVEDQEIVKVQRAAAWDLIKQMGQNLTQGASVINISMPVRLFEPRSYLQRITDGWCYAPVYLTRAANASDPVERLKCVVTFAIAGLSNTCTQLKPFNPILGETFQGIYDDGTEVFSEQSSHHPPITNWQVVGPAKSYHFYGFGEWAASFRGNSVKGHQKGIHVVEFPDGTKITYDLPIIWCKGIMFGERIVEYDGPVEFRDEKNELGCSIVINPPQSGGFLGWGKKKIPSDFFVGSIYRAPGRNFEESNRQKICEIEGSWLGCIEFNGEPYWDWQMGIPKFVSNPINNPLPSDCRYREDLIFLSSGDLEGSQEWKLKLEQNQRREAKLRKDGFEKKKVEATE
eukprot:TRINITY_DN345_c4_g1_i1.p1 TRINITY_DN345_c4_g1~~TRINITY_DN345_c4_g1_i1.p1  ORF type:complete len:361 (-),score=190.07 TRINITY_DN345_c4_g1_i1:115-1197(-)